MSNKILIDEAVVLQAAEALENAWLDASMGKGDVARHTKAITALRQALSDSVEQPRAEGTLAPAPVPEAHKPLTQDMVESCPYPGEGMREAYFAGWLKAEAAHGITSGKATEKGGAA